MHTQYNILAELENSTVVAKYESPERTRTGYQSENELENSLIAQLQQQGYEYKKSLTTDKQLVENLRECLQKLNNIELTDNEWKSLLSQIIDPSKGIQEKTETIQRSEILNITLDNGETKNIRLIDKKSIHNNILQVINQYKPEGGTFKNRYDVTVLVNGLPLVHIELKRRGVNIKEAFNQINRYQNDSFWSGTGLYDYVQIFVISNGTDTKYYSNTTRYAHVEEQKKQLQRKKKTDANSFEFTSYWSDQECRNLPDLEDFTRTFFAKHTILNIITKYCVFNADKQLLVMRPYQIAATEKILQRMNVAMLNKLQGSTKAGGYIWHTTGSGKTLTSFKTAQLASKMVGVEKVIFVVDRKDLDYQTMKEYDNFEKDCANGNSNYKILQKQLNDPNCNIIITTIQKLSILLKKKEEKVDVLDKNVVLIFDECHRSQFGDMREVINKRFKRYMIFGFTGTPIFPKNAGGALQTTEQAFGDKLHTYTIINAINDKNVLRFRVDYERTMRMKDNVESKDVWGIDTEEALHSPKRISIITKYILDHFAQKTKQGADAYNYSITTNVEEMSKAKGNGKITEQRERKSTRGFNSIFAVDSVPSAIAYYNEFKKQMAEPGNPKLRIATIFTYTANPNDDDTGFLEDENPENAGQLDQNSREALESAIQDYNATWGTSYSTDGDKFQNYYKDVSLRMKNKQIDILIVVGMFLTGFDAKTLNTLWVDKNLKMHGLLQSFSRTNRILNAVKDCGNIVCFRNLEDATNEALALFGDKDAGGIVLLRPFSDYYYGYDDEKGKHINGYKEEVDRLKEKFSLDFLLGGGIITDDQKKDFVKLFSRIIRLQNLLSAFDEFDAEKKIINEADMQDYTSKYIDFHDEMKNHDEKHTAELIDEDIIFEIDLVKQVEIDITYILRLVQEYRDGNCKDKEIVVKIMKAVSSSPDMRDKKELIERFIESMTPSSDEQNVKEKWYDFLTQVGENTMLEEGQFPYGNKEKQTEVTDLWEIYVQRERERELSAIIEEENLKEKETRSLMETAKINGYIETNGLALTNILPPMPLFGAGNKREEKKRVVIEKLEEWLRRYSGC
ncbi:MAG: type I restriction endonuclease subunit R [Paludibacteraceae bacterium]|nr:type I restriction endonuclease subunit R [Paludibacteraceae bacterium]